MECIRTGCVAYLDQYQEYVMGDAFMINDVLVIRVSWRGRENPRGYVNFTVDDVEQWWEDDPTGILFARLYTMHDVNGVRHD